MLSSHDKRAMRRKTAIAYDSLIGTMPAFDSTARKQAPPEPTFRTAPHNIEAEQALLGAILVNNEAFYRVSDFLEPKHFFEPIHQRIYELAGGLVRANKLATPVTLKTFLPGDVDIAGLSVNQYLARLAAEATTIINAQDYGRTVYDLSIRRDLITIGEDMVNLAYDAPVELDAAAATSRTPSANSTKSPRPAATIPAFSASPRRSPPRSTWRRAPISATAACPGSRPA